jgi:hypothetical protein
MDLLASTTAWILTWSLLLLLAPELVPLGGLLRRERQLAGALVGVVLVALALRWGATYGHQRLYTDEAYYVAAAGQLADHGHADPKGYAKAYGWPALIGVAFTFVGASNAAALHLCTALGALGAALAAGLAWTVQRRPDAAFWAGLMIAMWPLHGQWSRTSEANVPGATLASLAALCVWLAHAEPSRRRDLLVACAIATACNVRPEGWVLAGLALFLSLRSWPILLGMLCALPNLLAYSRVQLSTNLTRASGLGLDEAMWKPWHDLLGAPLHPPLFAATVAAAAVVAFVRQPRPAAVFLAWLLGTLSLLSFAGAGALTSPERFLIAIGAPAAALAGIGLSEVTRAVPRRAQDLTIFLFAAVLPVITFTQWQDAAVDLKDWYLLQQDLPSRVLPDLDPDCVLVAAHPEMYAGIVKQPVLSVEEFRSAPNAYCADLIWDLPCAEWGHAPYDRWCKEIKRLGGKPIARYGMPPPHALDDRRARLYHYEAPSLP